MVDIFNYLDYREFLRSFYEDQKKNSPFFSYRYLGQRVGMDSSFVIKVIQGNLHISHKKIEKFITVCSLTKKEAEYFEALVFFGKSKSGKENKMHLEKLLSLRDVKSRTFESKQYEFFKNWFHSAIWSLLNYYPFKGNFKELAARMEPAITEAQAKKSIKLLETLELIRKNEKGEYQVTDLNLSTGKEWSSVAVQEYQKQMMGLAEDALERFKKEERNISTLTMNIAPEALAEVDEITHQYRQSLKKLANNYPDAEGVYQLNVQLFPLVKKGKKK